MTKSQQPGRKRDDRSLDPRYDLYLYVAGMTPRSQAAISNLREFCELNLAGRYDLRVIDLYQQPQLAHEADILVAPTLVKRFPLPVRRLIGTMSSPEHITAGLGLNPPRPADRSRLNSKP